VAITRDSGGNQEIVKLREEKAKHQVLKNYEITKLAEIAQKLEEHYQKPQDIEWAKDGKNGKIYIVQARPETVKSREKHNYIETYKLNKKIKRNIIRYFCWTKNWSRKSESDRRSKTNEII